MTASDFVGFINVNKPAGMSSHDVVGFVRHLLPRGLKVGHLGTLDPGACGVLPVAAGWATRTIQYFPPNRKAYRAEVRLGVRTSSDDAHGEVLEIREVPEVSLKYLQSICSEFLGTYMQVPPKVSALHVDGRRAYSLLRTGQDFELEARPVQFYRVDVIGWNGPDRVLIDVECGPGTYIRSLARDIGERLGCGASLSFLLRTLSGCFTLSEAYTVEDIRRLGVLNCLIPADSVLCTALGRKGFIEKGRSRCFQGGQEFDQLWDESGNIINLNEFDRSSAWPVFDKEDGSFIGIGTQAAFEDKKTVFRLERLYTKVVQ